MRAGRSYLAAHQDALDPDRNPTCPRCLEEDETFHHAAIACPAHDRERMALCPGLLSIEDSSPIWRSDEDLRCFSRFCFLLVLISLAKRLSVVY